MSSKTRPPLFPCRFQTKVSHLFKLSISYAGVRRGGNCFLEHDRCSSNANLLNQDIKQGKY